METTYILLAFYFLNLFLGLKYLLSNNLNLANNIYTLILVLIFPFFTPIIYLFIFFDEQYRRRLVKKRTIDLLNLPDVNERLFSEHNDIQLFTNGKILFEDIFQEIKLAKNFIHISFFTINTDKIGKLMIKKLEEKLMENVEVKIMYDPLGSFIMKKKYWQHFKNLGGEIVPYTSLFKRLLNLNYRNHRKIIVIDNKIAYLGGFNIGDKYLGRDKKMGLWIDSQLKIMGNAVRTIEKRFLADYMYCTNKKIDAEKYLSEHQFTGMKQIEIITSGADISDINKIENKILHIIYSAKNYLLIQTPYLILNDSFLKALVYARSKGVDVRIMIPNKNDHPFVLQATKAYAAQLVENDITVYLFSKKAFLHSKIIVSDDYYVSIGTTNFDIRSFKYGLEINAFITNKDFASSVKEIFHKQSTYCSMYTKDLVKRKSLLTKLYEAFCKLLSTIL